MELNSAQSDQLLSVDFSWKSTLSNISSINSDVSESPKEPSKEIIEVLKSNRFEIANPGAKYSLYLEYVGKSSNYMARKDAPFKYMFRYGWATLSVISLAVIPYYSENEQFFKIVVTNLATKNTKSYEETGNFDLWV